jgi:pimeloyl-ACP methyl ester carboxylesterase
MATIRHEVHSADGTLIPVWISGEGRPLLVVHGAVSDHTAFDLLREQLEPRVTFAAIDRRGTFCDPSGRHELEREFEDIAAVADSLGPEIDLFGHSSGAVCSLGACLRLSNLRRLVMYEPPRRNKPNWPEMVRTMDALQAARDTDGIFSTWIQGETGLSDTAARKMKENPIGAAMFERANTLPREMSAMAGWDIDMKAYRDLRAATLYLTGADTRADNHVYMDLLKDVIPDFTHREIPSQGHMAHVLAPAVLAGLVLDFLQS